VRNLLPFSSELAFLSKNKYNLANKNMSRFSSPADSDKGAIANINDLLKPVLFQVIGSTPEGIKESIVKSGLKNDSVAACHLATAAIFSIAVNKATLETFASTPDMAAARPIISTAFSINNKVNMTAMSLLGHCLLLSPIVSNIEFVQRFRIKMGQDSIWDGDFRKGTLGETQKGIFVEKQKVIGKGEAWLLGNGFWKYTGVSKAAYTEDEARFWGEPVVRAQGSPSRKSGTVDVKLPGGGVARVSASAVEYYLAVNEGDRNRMAASIESRGADEWSKMYSEASAKDPARKGRSGSTVVG
jgi:hypothetical protein